MHEFGITARIMQTVIKAAEENGAQKVVSIDLVIGQLTFLNLRQVRLAYDILARGSVSEGAELIIEERKGLVRCLKCSHQREVEIKLPENTDVFPETSGLVACLACGGKVEILNGKECQVVGIAFEA